SNNNSSLVSAPAPQINSAPAVGVSDTIPGSIGGSVAGGKISIPSWVRNPIGLLVYAMVYSPKLGDGTLSGAAAYEATNGRLMYHYSPAEVLIGPLMPGQYLTPYFG